MRASKDYFRRISFGHTMVQHTATVASSPASFEPQSPVPQIIVTDHFASDTPSPRLSPCRQQGPAHLPQKAVAIPNRMQAAARTQQQQTGLATSVPRRYSHYFSTCNSTALAAVALNCMSVMYQKFLWFWPAAKRHGHWSCRAVGQKEEKSDLYFFLAIVTMLL